MVTFSHLFSAAVHSSVHFLTRLFWCHLVFLQIWYETH